MSALAGEPIVRAPMPGRVLEILVAEGESVRAGQPVMRVEAMKMEVDLQAPIDGSIAEVHVVVEQLVEQDTVLITLTPVVEADS